MAKGRPDLALEPHRSPAARPSRRARRHWERHSAVRQRHRVPGQDGHRVGRPARLLREAEQPVATVQPVARAWRVGEGGRRAPRRRHRVAERGQHVRPRERGGRRGEKKARFRRSSGRGVGPQPRRVRHQGACRSGPARPPGGPQVDRRRGGRQPAAAGPDRRRDDRRGAGRQGSDSDANRAAVRRRGATPCIPRRGRTARRRSRTTATCTGSGTSSSGTSGGSSNTVGWQPGSTRRRPTSSASSGSYRSA
ncbi:hypothetical protein PX52LOC_07028 [Limnoglobus roseus]|uniref:Uncharacterized protein n=1 Tax=Limnoglobus roseus TaxID=2598579 RepID=A0A5C1AMZ6_9BACT|nr:hypothetical protein PX52LOC_07028 [Limnoglobus roseus]